MKHRAQRRTAARAVLFGVAIIAIGAGVGTALYSWLVLVPKVAYATQVEKNLEFADQALEAAGQGDGLLARSIETFDSQGKLLSLLPETFAQSASVLRAASQTSSSAGKTANKAGEGVTGLVLPDEETKESARALGNTAVQMRELAKAVDGLGGASKRLAGDVAGLSRELSDALPRLKSDTSGLSIARRDIQGLERAIADFDPPALAMLSGFGIGGLYAVIGLMALAGALAVPDSHPHPEQMTA